jgi:hypothetical protein
MSEEYEFDENGGHKDKISPDGKRTSPGLGCNFCNAGFYTADAREKHSRQKHPFENYGANPGEIDLVRIRPEMAKLFGVWQGKPEEDLGGWSEHEAPVNVAEFLEGERRKDVFDAQETRRDEIDRHPITKHIHALRSDLNLLEAEAKANSGSDDDSDIREERTNAEHELRQAHAGIAIGKSINEPGIHLGRALEHGEGLSYYLPEERQEHWQNKLYEHHENILDFLN